MYFDASALVPTFVKERSSAVIDGFLDRNRDELLISDFAATEVASAVSRLVRTRVLDQTSGAAGLADFEAWRAATSTPVELYAADARLAYAYVRRFELSLRAPDALHLAACRRLGATLVTLDQRLAAAAHALGIDVHLPHP